MAKPENIFKPYKIGKLPDIARDIRKSERKEIEIMLLEEMINDSYSRIPERSKKEIKNLAFNIEDEFKEKPGSDAYYTGIPGKRDGFNKIAFCRKRIMERFQEFIDKLMIHELAHYFGFGENKAYKLMNNKKLNGKSRPTKRNSNHNQTAFRES